MFITGHYGIGADILSSLALAIKGSDFDWGETRGRECVCA